MSKKVEKSEEEKLAEEIVKKYDAKTGKDLNQIMRDFMGPVIQKMKDAINTAYPKTEYQRCIVHQIRNSLKYVKHENKEELERDLRKVYTSSTAEQGFKVLVELDEKWSKKYPSAIRSWQDNWDSLSTFFQYS